MDFSDEEDSDDAASSCTFETHDKEDQEIDCKEAWIDAMVQFIWEAKDACELPGKCPELTSWLQVWNDAESETGKRTVNEMLEVVQKGIVALGEKRQQYYFDMQKVEDTATNGDVEAADLAFKQVGAYAADVRVYFSEWIRKEIADKLNILAEARETAVTEGTATNRTVKIAKDKLRTKGQRVRGNKGRKSGTETGGGAARKTRKDKKEKARKKPETVKEDTPQEEADEINASLRA